MCCLIYTDGNLARDPPRWKFNQKWLQDEAFIKYVGAEIDNYFKDNTMQTTACIKWDVFKAFLRGHIISYTASKFRESRQNTQQLECKIQTQQEQVFRNSTPEVEKELLLLRAEYNKLLADGIAQSAKAEHFMGTVENVWHGRSNS